MSAAREFNAAQYRQALDIVDALIAPPRADTGARAPGDGDAEQRARLADLRHVRTMLYHGRSAQEVVDQLMALCPCGIGPDVEGPQQDCPVHGDGLSFVDLCRWRDMVVGGAHALIGTHDPSRRVSDNTAAVVDAGALARFRELLDSGPWASPMPGQPAGP